MHLMNSATLYALATFLAFSVFANIATVLGRKCFVYSQILPL